MSKIKNGRLGLYGAEHSKCNRMMTLGFKGLMTPVMACRKCLTYIQSVAINGTFDSTQLTVRWS